MQKVPFGNAVAHGFRALLNGGGGTFVHGRVPIIDPLARARVPAKARLVAATLIFPGVFARTSVIIDRRPIRADPPLRT